jgi:hypothetical protein
MKVTLRLTMTNNIKGVFGRALLTCSGVGVERALLPLLTEPNFVALS